MGRIDRREKKYNHPLALEDAEKTEGRSSPRRHDGAKPETDLAVMTLFRLFYKGILIGNRIRTK